MNVRHIVRKEFALSEGSHFAQKFHLLKNYLSAVWKTRRHRFLLSFIK